ncbi:MAG: ABC transporter permease, partial [Clostridiales bacterium]|nr:ABC transporter permease [Clostridiales bacterium]
MLRYILNRLLMFIPVLLGVLFIVFAINHLSPGDPVVQQLGSNYTQEQYDAKEAEMGLDKPFFVQFYTYTKGIVTRMDLGTSYQTHRSVGREIVERLPVTLKLSLMGICITILLGIPFGIISALKQGKWQDNLCMFIATFGITIP